MCSKKDKINSVSSAFAPPSFPKSVVQWEEPDHQPEHHYFALNSKTYDHGGHSPQA